MAIVQPSHDALHSIARRHADQTGTEEDAHFNYAHIWAVQRRNPDGGAYLRDVTLARTVELHLNGVGPQIVALYVEGLGHGIEPDAAAAGLTGQDYDIAVLNRAVSPLEQTEQEVAANMSVSRGVDPKHAHVFELLGPVSGSDLLAAPVATEIYIPLR
jgi:hypothetical protein